LAFPVFNACSKMLQNLPLHQRKGRFERVHGNLPSCDSSARVNVLIHVNGMPQAGRLDSLANVSVRFG
jgi:hypothetical protein